MPTTITSPRTSWLLACASGAALALAFPGSGDQAWLAFLALVPLLIAITGAAPRRAAGLGFVSAVVFWLGTVSWTVPGVMRATGMSWPRPMLVFIVMILALSSFTAVFCVLVARSPVRSGAAYVVVAASVWVALELVRTELVVRFPWNVLGYSQYRNPSLIQVASLTGVYGVSFVVVAVNAAVARTVMLGRRWSEALPALGVGAMVFGAALIPAWLTPARDVAPAIDVTLIQASIPQEKKWDPAHLAETLGIYRAMTLGSVTRLPELVVWPETAVPLRRRDDPAWAYVEDVARAAGRHLLVGAPDWQLGQPRNSASLFDPHGRAIGRYDKRHLVPFGEYVPYHGALFFLDAIAGQGFPNFVPGAEPGLLSTPLGRLGVVICYEVIFPTEVRSLFTGGADILVNLTNDGWFGRSPAPFQHLAMSVFRAVENRTYLVRAANTGISAIVAPDGRIVRASGLFTREVIAGSIARRAETTFYTRHGDVFAWLAVAVAVAALPVRFRVRRSVRQRATAT